MGHVRTITQLAKLTQELQNQQTQPFPLDSKLVRKAKQLVGRKQILSSGKVNVHFQSYNWRGKLRAAQQGSWHTSMPSLRCTLTGSRVPCPALGAHSQGHVFHVQPQVHTHKVTCSMPSLRCTHTGSRVLCPAAMLLLCIPPKRQCRYKSL